MDDYRVPALCRRLGTAARRSLLAAVAVALSAGCGDTHSTTTTAKRDVEAQARAQLLRAASDVMAYGRAHHTFDVGGVAGLHRLDPRTPLVNFVDGRRTSFFLAVQPPTTRTIWRYDYDHNAISRAECLPGARRCLGMRRW
jgi:hypothetical protein